MNEAQTERLLSLLGLIADSVAILAGERDPDEAPDIEMPMGAYRDFDWSSLGARILASDEDGATVVQYNGKTYRRRSPENQFDAAIWYSRCIGKDETGRNEYVRLVSFRSMKEDSITPLSRKAERMVAGTPRVAAPQAAALPMLPPADDAPASGTVNGTQAPNGAETTNRTHRTNGTHTAGSNMAGEGALSATSAAPPVAGAAQSDARGGPDLCPNCGKPWQLENQACRQHRGPEVDPPPSEQAALAAKKTSKRQATIGGGRAGGEFRLFAKDFANRYPKYLIRATGDPDLYHILMTVASFGIEQITAENLATIQVRLEAHAAQDGS